jgi:hypothetical protein
METTAMMIETPAVTTPARTPALLARWCLAGLLALACLLPAAAQAQELTTKVCNNNTPIDQFGSQEREMLGLVKENARRLSEVMEKWINTREVSEERLFSALYYPIPKTDPVKYNTEWDHLADRDIQETEETALSRSPSIVYVVFVDRNGYLPTHNRKFSLPLTGNYAQDLTNNRTKRMFADRTGLAASQNEQDCLIQPYKRDTGEIMYDISVPVHVSKKHFGALRIGYRPVAPK